MRLLREIPRAFRALVIVPPLYGIDWYAYFALVILQWVGVIDWPEWALLAPLAAGIVSHVVYGFGRAYDRRTVQRQSGGDGSVNVQAGGDLHFDGPGAR